MRRFATVLLCGMSLSPSLLRGQAASHGVLTGVVANDSGVEVSTAELTALPSGRRSHLLVRRNFWFYLDSLPPGWTTVVVESPGFTRLETDSILIRPGQVDTVTFKLELAPYRLQELRERSRLCREGPPSLTPGRAQQLARTPQRLRASGAPLVVSAHAWLNLQGPPPRDCRFAPLRVSFSVVTADSTPMPGGLSVDSAWIVSDSLGFAAAVAPPSDTVEESDARIAGWIWGGAWWVEGRHIDLILRVRARSGQSWLLRLAGISVGTAI